MNELDTPATVAGPANRIPGARIIFGLLALGIPLCSLLYHFMVWSVEQSALTSLSLSQLAWAGLIGLIVQAFGMSVIAGLLWRFSNDDRFKSVYFGWFIAALMAFPALILRVLGPNNDQLGSLIQFLLCTIAAGVVFYFHRKSVSWNVDSLGFGLMIAAIGMLPLAIHGALGSPGDIVLNILAGTAFGVLTALLIVSTTGSVFLDAFGIAAVLSLLGSAIGYDGSQLILLAVLPPFALAIAALMPSRAAAAAAAGLLAFASLAFFDPTEMTIMLADTFTVAVNACGIAMLTGLLIGAIALILRAAAGTRAGLGWAGAVVSWTILMTVFFTAGQPGNYGDRLFVILEDQTDISSVADISDRNARLTAAYRQLTAHAAGSQASLRESLDSAGIQYTPYYLQNAMEVRGGTLVRLYLLMRPEVDRVILSPRLRPVPPDEPVPGSMTSTNGEVQWNVAMIGADRVWEEFDARGEGIVIGQSDSGVDGDHPAIHDQYRGLTEGDDYNWFDPWDGTTSPNDEGGHGTHTLGTILGADGIGVAPAAKWIGCVNLDRNLANPALYLDCLQFMLAPFPRGGDPFTDGDPARAPHVLNNSWGCPMIEGCDANALRYAADNLRYAGIFVVASAGNDGPSCSTVAAPLSLYDSVFSVGAINESGNLADFSSRGPVTADGSGRVKPDIAAPGVDILSSLPKNTYGANSGTSTAGPHVVGAVALIWSAVPDLIGKIDATEQLIIETARPYAGDPDTGCFSSGKPSNAYGYGVLDVYAAVKEALH